MIRKLMTSCASNSYDEVRESVSELVHEGHAASQVISQLHDEVLAMKISDDHKSHIMETIAVRSLFLLLNLACD